MTHSACPLGKETQLQKMKPMKIHFALLIAAFLVTGCAFNVGFNPAYLPGEAQTLEIPGKGLVVIDATDDNWISSEHPTSFTGSATTLAIPIGTISREVAMRVFGAAFKEGADFRNVAGDTSGYQLVVMPKVTKFTYAYNSLQNLGFAITPQVDIGMHVTLTAPDGHLLLDKVYASGLVNGNTYVMSGQPAEMVNKLVHITLFNLMTSAAKDAKQIMARQPKGSHEKGAQGKEEISI
jgi:hypothetical protein